MHFADWMRTDEIRRGPAPGAFGRDMRRSGYSHGKFDNATQDRFSRVQYGKSIEEKIFVALKACGMDLVKPSANQDRFDKVDAYWKAEGNKYEPLQIKYRDKGQDILFEVMVDYERGVPGRDMVGKATYYAVLTPDGKTVNVVRVADAKAIIEKMEQEARQVGFDQTNSFNKPMPGGGVAQLKVRPDPASRQTKLMAFIPVSALPVVKRCDVNVAFD